MDEYEPCDCRQPSFHYYYTAEGNQPRSILVERACECETLLRAKSVQRQRRNYLVSSLSTEEARQKSVRNSIDGRERTEEG
jgi:hypothetical protein